MGYIKNRIKELSVAAKGKTRARKIAEEWFSDSLRSRKEDTVVSTRTAFEPGKIYVFEYAPVTKNLPWFDKNPVVLAMDPTPSGDDIGVNLNLLPIRIKEQMLDDLYNNLEGQIKSASSGSKENHAKRQRALRITYDGVKNYLDQYGFGFAIRRYKRNRKTRQAVVSYNRWPEIALCDFIELEGANKTMLRVLFEEYNRKRNI